MALLITANSTALALVAASFLIFPTPAAPNGVQAQAKMSLSTAGAIE